MNMMGVGNAPFYHKCGATGTRSFQKDAFCVFLNSTCFTLFRLFWMNIFALEVPMRVPLTALLTYYRNSLADADRMAPDDNLVQSALLAEEADWSEGQLHREHAEQLWAARSPNGKTEIDEWGRKRYWYCPWVGTLKPEHGAHKP